MRRPLAILFLTLFTSIVGLSILFPVMGPLGRELGLREREIGMVSSAYALLQLLCAPFWGRASERFGRKPVMMIGTVGFGVGFALLGTAVELGRAHVLGHDALVASMVGARAVGGALSSAMLPTAQAYVADVTPPEKRTQGMAVLGGAFGLAVIVGPALGAGITTLFDLVAPIWTSVALAVMNLALIALVLPVVPRAAPIARPAGGPSLFRRVAPLLLVGLVATTATVLVEQTIAFSYEDLLHLEHRDTPRWVGGALVAYGVVAVLTQGVLVRRATLTPRALLLLGTPLLFLSMIGLTFADGLVTLTLSLLLQALGQGLVLPGVSAAISVEARSGEQGPLMGLHGSAQGIGRFLGPLIGPSLYGIDRTFPYALGAVLVAVTLGLVLLGARRPVVAHA